MIEENQTKPKEKLKNRYIFPDILGKAMAKVSMRAQLESAMLSQFLLIIGMVLMAAYTVIYGNLSLWMKCSVTFNILCGLVLMSSYLITSFQQYQNHMEFMKFDASAEREEIKKKGNIFKRIIVAIKNRKASKVEKKEEAKLPSEETIQETERRYLEENL